MHAPRNAQCRSTSKIPSPLFRSDSLPRLFERFYRVDGSRNRASGGAGLGLAICKNIVEAHQGTIAAHASPLGGLWIAVTLPLAEGLARIFHEDAPE